MNEKARDFSSEHEKNISSLKILRNSKGKREE